MLTHSARWLSHTARTRAVGMAALLSVAVGCGAHHGATSDDAIARTNDPRTIITHEELGDSRVMGASVLEAIRVLRPMYLSDASTMSKGAASQTEASINGGPPRPLRDLSGISASSVLDIRYLTVGEAQRRFGVRARMGPVILVTLPTS